MRFDSICLLDRQNHVADITPEIAPQVLEACTTNAEEMAGALGRTFDGEIVVKPTEPSAYDAEAKKADLAGPGMAFLFRFGDVGITAILTAADGLLPEWCSHPDPTGESKLSTLGQELSMLMVPDDLMADSFEAVWHEDLSVVLANAEPGEGAICLPLELAMGETLATLHMVWPLAKPDALLASKQAEEESTSEAPSSEEEQSNRDTESDAENGEEDSKQRVSYFDRIPSDYSELPPNTLSLLKVMVPISVNLASKKQRVDEVIEFGPGSIITFEKSCNDLLEITAAGRPIAEGEAVKVGEKFGIRIRKIKLPNEHFKPILPPKAG